MNWEKIAQSARDVEWYETAIAGVERMLKEFWDQVRILIANWFDLRDKRISTLEKRVEELRKMHPIVEVCGHKVMVHNDISDTPTDPEPKHPYCCDWFAESVKCKFIFRYLDRWEMRRVGQIQLCPNPSCGKRLKEK